MTATGCRQLVAAIHDNKEHLQFMGLRRMSDLFSPSHLPNISSIVTIHLLVRTSRKSLFKISIIIKRHLLLGIRLHLSGDFVLPSLFPASAADGWRGLRCSTRSCSPSLQVSPVEIHDISFPQHPPFGSLQLPCFSYPISTFRLDELRCPAGLFRDVILVLGLSDMFCKIITA